jgi:hypothetical protein
MGISAVITEVAVAHITFSKFTVGTRVTYCYTALFAVNKIFLVNCLIITALVAIRILSCTAPLCITPA